MIRRAERPRTNFTIIQNSVLLDDRLSYRARGLLCAILSRPDNWRVRADQLAREGSEGRGAVLTALKELRAIGYLHLHRMRLDDGTFRSEQVVYDTPWLPSADSSSDTPESSYRTPDNRTPDNRTPLQEPRVRTENKKTTLAHASVSTTMPVDFDQFWGIYPRKVGKGAALKRWRSMSAPDRHAALDAVPRHTARWSRERTETRFIPHPATWLSQGRWHDDLSTEARYEPTMPSAVRHAAERIQEALAREQQTASARTRQLLEIEAWEGEP